MEIIPKQMRYRHRLMVLLVSAVSLLAENLTAFLIDNIFIDGYMLISSTDAIATLSILIFSFSSLYFRSYAWKMEKRE